MKTIKHKFTGEQITFLQSTAETNGEFLYIEVALPPLGKGPPLHAHDAFVEEFEVVEGILTVTVEKTKQELHKGDLLVAPIGTKHTFTNAHNEPVTFRVKLIPGVYFEESACIHYGLMDDGLTDDKGNPKTLAHTALILTMQNTLVAGIPLGLQRLLFKRIVKSAYKKGKYNQLQKYIETPISEVITKLFS